MNRDDIPSDLRRHLRVDSRRLDDRATAHQGELHEDTIIDWFEEAWACYKADLSEIVLALLLRDLLTAARESGRFTLTIESWTERLATSRNRYGKIIFETFFEEAIEGYRLDCQDHGPLPIGGYFPIIPEGQAFAAKSGPYFREFLEIYWNAFRRGGSGDVLSACWADLARDFRKSPYSEVFCHFFELPMPGQILERHTLENPVGIGGMGVVYLAMHEDGYRVALKLLRPDCPAQAQFLLEGRNTVQIRDRRFVVVKETHLQAESTPFFTMDYVEGGTSLSDLIDRPEDYADLIESLSEYLRVDSPNRWNTGGLLATLRRINEEIRRRIDAARSRSVDKKTFLHYALAPVSWICRCAASMLAGVGRKGGLDSARGDRFFAAIVAEIAEAADYLHRPKRNDQDRESFVHGDIKPGNILLSRRNGPLLTDLGLSRRLDSDGNSGKEKFVGTASYSSPEQARGDSMTARSDVYQLGALLYRAFTGRAPFKANAGEDTEQTLKRVCTEKLQTPRERRSKVHRHVERICLRALQREPEDRYATAQALADDLKRFVGRKPVQACDGYVWRSICYRAAHSVWMWVFLMLSVVLVYEAWMDHAEIAGIEASRNKYRIRSEMSAPMKPELLIGVDWQDPKYDHVRVEKSSVMMDLTRWRPVQGEAYKAGRIEPAFYTRVVTLQKIPGHRQDNGRFEVSFQFRTGGADVDLRCPTHPYRVTGSEGREKLGGKEVKVREIVVDLTKERCNMDVTIVIQGVIWNGFQANSKGLQWAAFLSPTRMAVGELAVLFPAGGKPGNPPKGYIIDRSNPERESQPLELNEKNFENPSNALWWALRQKGTEANCAYMLEFDWKRPGIPPASTAFSKNP